MTGQAKSTRKVWTRSSKSVVHTGTNTSKENVDGVFRNAGPANQCCTTGSPATVRGPSEVDALQRSSCGCPSNVQPLNSTSSQKLMSDCAILNRSLPSLPVDQRRKDSRTFETGGSISVTSDGGASQLHRSSELVQKSAKLVVDAAAAASAGDGDGARHFNGGTLRNSKRTTSTVAWSAAAASPVAFESGIGAISPAGGCLLRTAASPPPEVDEDARRIRESATGNRSVDDDDDDADRDSDGKSLNAEDSASAYDIVDQLPISSAGLNAMDGYITAPNAQFTVNKRNTFPLARTLTVNPSTNGVYDVVRDQSATTDSGHNNNNNNNSDAVFLHIPLLADPDIVKFQFMTIITPTRTTPAADIERVSIGVSRQPRDLPRDLVDLPTFSVLHESAVVCSPHGAKFDDPLLIAIPIPASVNPGRVRIAYCGTDVTADQARTTTTYPAWTVFPRVDRWLFVDDSRSPFVNKGGVLRNDVSGQMEVVLGLRHFCSFAVLIDGHEEQVQRASVDTFVKMVVSSTSFTVQVLVVVGCDAGAMSRREAMATKNSFLKVETIQYIMKDSGGDVTVCLVEDSEENGWMDDCRIGGRKTFTLSKNQLWHGIVLPIQFLMTSKKAVHRCVNSFFRCQVRVEQQHNETLEFVVSTDLHELPTSSRKKLAHCNCHRCAVRPPHRASLPRPPYDSSPEPASRSQSDASSTVDSYHRCIVVQPTSAASSTDEQHRRASATSGVAGRSTSEDDGSRVSVLSQPLRSDYGEELAATGGRRTDEVVPSSSLCSVPSQVAAVEAGLASGEDVMYEALLPNAGGPVESGIAAAAADGGGFVECGGLNVDGKLGGKSTAVSSRYRQLRQHLDM